MIEHVIRALQPVVSRIIVVTNSREKYAAYDVELAGDAFDVRGSLIGLYSGLMQSRDDYSVVVACDMPFLNSQLISYMKGLTGGHDVILPKLGEFIEPLHAVYRKSLLPSIEEHIKRDQRRIRSIFAGKKIRFVTEEEIDRFDPGRRSFLNLNTREEYEEATCSDLECRN